MNLVCGLTNLHRAMNSNPLLWNKLECYLKGRPFSYMSIQLKTKWTQNLKSGTLQYRVESLPGRVDSNIATAEGQLHINALI